MQLSKNFSLEELTVTNSGAINVPNDEQKDKLLYVANFLLQPIRDKFGAIQVNSGFRSEFVNEKIGGSKTSQHMEGEASDFDPLNADMKEVFEWCRHNLIFGQLIDEYKGDSHWIHISLPRIDKPNMMVLMFKDGSYTNI